MLGCTARLKYIGDFYTFLSVLPQGNHGTRGIEWV